jgi:hypothetical protein
MEQIMGKVVTFIKPGKVKLTEFKDLPLKHNEVRIVTLYSGISAGTELTHYRGTNVYLHKKWDDVNAFLFLVLIQLQRLIKSMVLGMKSVGK